MGETPNRPAKEKREGNDRKSQTGGKGESSHFGRDEGGNLAESPVRGGVLVGFEMRFKEKHGISEDGGGRGHGCVVAAGVFHYKNAKQTGWTPRNSNAKFVALRVNRRCRPSRNERRAEHFHLVHFPYPTR